METIVLVIDRPGVHLDDLARGFTFDHWLSDNGKSLILQDSSGNNVYVVEVLDAERDGVFEDWPADLLPESPGSIFALDYRQRSFAVAIVKEVAQLYEVLVDTNFGEVVRGDQLSESHLLLR
jgi:hypothetical protein